MSVSCEPPCGPVTLLGRLCRFEFEEDGAVAGFPLRDGKAAETGATVCGFGGPGAIGTTPPLELVAVDPELATPEPTEPVADLGDSDSGAEALPEGVDVPDGCAIEFLRDPFLLEERVETGAVPLPRLRFLMTSVLRDKGRTTPCSFRKSPQALQSGWPSGFRRQSGVVCVKQFVQVVGAPLWSPCLLPLGLPGLDESAVLKPDSGGELGDD